MKYSQRMKSKSGKKPIKKEPFLSFHVIATKAMHQLGDISRPDGDLALISDEDKSDWIGSWMTGFGFINVRFPKETTRDLTDEEVEKYEKRSIQYPWGIFPIKISRRGRETSK